MGEKPENRKYKATEEDLKIPGIYLLSILEDAPEMSARDMMKIYLRECFLHLYLWDKSLEDTESIAEKWISDIEEQGKKSSDN